MEDDAGVQLMDDDERGLRKTKRRCASPSVIIAVAFFVVIIGAGVAVGGIFLFDKSKSKNEDKGKAASSKAPPAELAAPAGMDSNATAMSIFTELDQDEADAKLITLDVVDQFISRAKKVGKLMGVNIDSKDIFMSSRSILAYIRDMKLDASKEILRDFADGVQLQDLRVAKLKKALKEIQHMFTKEGVNEWGKVIGKRHGDRGSKTNGTAVNLGNILDTLKKEGYDLENDKGEGGEGGEVAPVQKDTTPATKGDKAGAKEEETKGKDEDEDVKKPTEPVLDVVGGLLGLQDKKDDVTDVVKGVTGVGGQKEDKGSKADIKGDVADEADVEEEAKEEEEEGAGDTNSSTKGQQPVAVTTSGEKPVVARGAADEDADPTPVVPSGGLKRTVSGGRKILQASKSFNRVCMKLVFHVFQYQNRTRGPFFPATGRFKTGAEYLVNKTNYFFQQSEYPVTNGASKDRARYVPRIQFKLHELRDDSKKYPYLKLSYDDWKRCSTLEGDDFMGFILRDNKMDPAQHIHVFFCGWFGISETDGYANIPEEVNSWTTWGENVPGHFHHIFMTLQSLDTTTYNRPQEYDGAAVVMAHELGHHLGLFHPHDGGCAVDKDGLADTPQSMDISQQNYYWEAHSMCDAWRTIKKPLDWNTLRSSRYDSCRDKPGNDAVFNIMSYGPRACASHFTVQQVLLMRAAILQYRPLLYKNNQGRC